MVQRFVDRNRGNDANDGLTPQTAWAELTKLDDAAYTAGDELLLASDSVWEYDLATRVIPPTTWAGTRERPVVIGSYAPLSAAGGTRPTIRWNRRILANEWVYDAPNNAWTYTCPQVVGFLCFIRLADTWESSRTDEGLPLASVPGRYNSVGTTLYLWAPSNTNPTDYYGEVLLSPTGAGFFTISSNRKFVEFNGLRFEQMGCGIFGYSGSAFDVGVKVRDIEAQTISSVIEIITETASGQMYADIQGVRATDWGAAVIHGYAINGAGFRQFDVSRCDIRDGLHSHSQGAVYCQVRTAGFTPRIFDNYFSGVRWGTKDKESDGCAVYCETGADGVHVFGNTVEDSYMPFQDGSGRGNFFYNNVALRCKSFLRFGDGAGNAAMALSVFNNSAIVGTPIEPAYGTATADIGIRGFLPAGTINSITIKNNLIVNTGATAAAAISTPQATPAASDYTFNAVSGFTNVAQREYTPFTVETSTGSITSGLLHAADGRPLPGSPLLTQGADLGLKRDMNGVQGRRYIGAFAAAALREVA